MLDVIYGASSTDARDNTKEKSLQGIKADLFTVFYICTYYCKYNTEL